MAGTMTRRFKQHLVAAVARLWRRPRLTAGQLRALAPRGVLIVKQHNQMGDMVCAIPALRALRGAYPEGRMVLVTSPVNGAVVSHDPNLDAVMTFSQRMWRRPWALLRFVRELRAHDCELAFILGSVSFSVTSAVIALASGARWIVGPDSRPYGWDISGHLFAVELPASPHLDRHAVAHNLAPLQAVGIDTGDRLPRFDPDAAERARAASVMAELGLRDGFWSLHPGAGKRQNVWRADRFAAVAAKAAAAGRQVLILHGPADGPYLQRLLAALAPAEDPNIRVAPDLEVGVCAALLQRSDRFLCNDTGIMHVAGAVGTPTLALFGPTDPRLWKPPAPQVVALRSPRRSADDRGDEFGWMQNIAVEDVWRAWTSLPSGDDRGGSLANERSQRG